MSIQLNIQNRLLLVLWGTTLLAFLIAAIGLALWQNLTLEQRAWQIMQPYAELVAVGTDTAVAFEDPVRAKEILDTLRANPQIREADIFLESGQLLASFSHTATARSPSLPTKPDGIYLDADAAELLQTLPSGAHLRLNMGLEQLSRQTHQLMWFLGAGMLVLLAAKLGQLLVLRLTIVRPIANLTEATERVRAGADYRHRVPASGSDEVARLGRNFNAMMAAIQERDEDLRRLNQFQRTILDNAAYVIVSCAPDGTITSFNPAAERLLGYTADEVVGKQTPALWHDPQEIARRAQILSEELSETVQPGFDAFVARARRNLKEEDEWTFICKDGRCVPVNVSITALRDEDGQIKGFVGLAYDLTERKQVETRLRASEQEFRTLAENSPDVIIRYDRQGRRIYVNPEFERVNRLPAQQVLGKTPFEFSTMLTPRMDVFMEKLMATMASGVAAKVDLSWVQDGKPICWFVRVIPEFDDDRKVVSALTIWSDISERKQAEEKLRRYKDDLEETVQRRTKELLLARDAADAANKAKSVFLANMSHELRTPLNAILGFSEMLLKNALFQGDERRNVEIINRSGEHLLMLINNVLEMAKIEAGRVQLDEAPFDLQGMLRDVVNMMQVRANEKSLELVVDQSSAFPRYIVGDEARLRQILINLVGNALKFTEKGGVTLRVGTKDNAISHLLIEVEDTGPGIAQEDQEHIFEPFVQLGPLADSKGTGLGLSITRQFVQLMKGHIGLESALGKGSLFRIDLPLKLADAADIGSVCGAKAKDVLRVAPGQTDYRILVAEDQLENRLLLANLMESVGFRIKMAENGEAAVALFQDWQPHLIWMDRQMPVMDGLQATQAIRALPGGKQVKIVAVTASAFAEQRTEMLAAGMDDFICKPYRAKEIYDCLSRHLGVQYVYSEPQASTEEAVVLTPDMLSMLPEALLKELDTTVKTLDSERIELIIEQIGGYDRQLAATLTRLAKDYDYPAILKALRTG